MEAGAGVRGASGARSRRLIAAVLAGAILIGVAVGFGSHLLLTGHRAPAAVQTPKPMFDGEATWAAGARPAPAIDTLRDQTTASSRSPRCVDGRSRSSSSTRAATGVPARGPRARRRRATTAAPSGRCSWSSASIRSTPRRARRRGDQSVGLGESRRGTGCEARTPSSPRCGARTTSSSSRRRATSSTPRRSTSSTGVATSVGVPVSVPPGAGRTRHEDPRRGGRSSSDE